MVVEEALDVEDVEEEEVDAKSTIFLNLLKIKKMMHLCIYKRV